MSNIRKKILLLLVVVFTFLSLFACKGALEKKVYSGSVMVYTTLEETIINDIKYNFEEKYEGVVLDYYFGNIDSIKSKLESSYELDLPEVDVIIINSEKDLQSFKSANYVTAYTSKENKKIKDEFKGISDGFYVVATDEAGNNNYIAIVSNSMNKDNAELLIDYLLSKKGQEELIKDNLKSVRKDIK